MDVPSSAHEHIIGHFGCQIYDVFRGAYQSCVFPSVGRGPQGIKMGNCSYIHDLCFALDYEYASPAVVDAGHQVISAIVGKVGVSEDLDHLLSKSIDYVMRLLVDVVVAVDAPLSAEYLTYDNLYLFTRNRPGSDQTAIPADTRYTFNLRVPVLEWKFYLGE